MVGFLEAVGSMVDDNSYVQRETWEKDSKYLCRMPGIPHVWQILTAPNPNAATWLPLVDDFLATDWKIVKKIDPVKPAETV